MIVRANGIDLFYEKTGIGRPLIMLHGNGETHKIFKRAEKILKEKFTVYLLDTRGHGESGETKEFHYDDFAEDLKCFIEELKIEKPVVYGFSDGGITALLTAIKYPDLLSQLIISGANLNPDGLKSGFLQFLKLANGNKPDAKTEMMLSEPDITEDDLNNIKIRVTVLAGQFDIIKASHTKEIAEKIKNSRLKIIPLAGHGSYIVHRRKIAKIIEGECLRPLT